VYNPPGLPIAPFLGLILKWSIGGVITIGHFARLQLAGRITYYAGWIALVCDGLVHLNVAGRWFMALTLTQGNLFEVSALCFLICVASELRALVPVGNEKPSFVKRQAAPHRHSAVPSRS